MKQDQTGIRAQMGPKLFASSNHQCNNRTRPTWAYQSLLLLIFVIILGWCLKLIYWCGQQIKNFLVPIEHLPPVATRLDADSAGHIEAPRSLWLHAHQKARFPKSECRKLQ